MTDELVLPFDKSRDSRLSRRGFAALSLGVGVAAAHQAAAADPALIETDVVIKTADGDCDAAFIHPEGSGKHPGVIIFTDVLGLRPAFRTMGRQLAAQGYAVLIPNPFYRVKKAPVLDGPFDFNNPTDRAKLGTFTASLAGDARKRDIAAHIQFIDTLKPVDSKAKLGVAGYCMGGPYVFIAASHADRVGAGGSFHGGGLVADTPDSPHLLIPQMKAALYVAIATNDDQRQPDAKTKLKAAFEAAHVKATVEVYDGCQHGWCVPDGAVYNRAGAERAFGDLVALYKGALV